MKKFRALLASFLVLAMAVTTIATATPQKAFADDDMTGKLVILHTNDMHGNYETVDGHMGIATVAAAKKYYQSLGADVLLFDAGDFSQGTTLVSYYKGLSAIKFMNAAGYDAASLGNHEFDFGFDALLAMVEEANFPILDANLLSKETGKPYFGGNTIFETSNHKVGVFGLDTAETQTKSSPKNIQFVSFLDGEELYACAQAQVDELVAAGCDVIVCIGHLGVDVESTGRRSTDVMEKVNGIDLFIDGHSHTEIDGGELVNGGLVVSTGNYLENLGVVVIDEAGTVAAKLVSAKDITYGQDEEVKTLVTAAKDEVAGAYSAKFATSLVDLNGNKAPGVRTEETNLGNFAASSYLYAAQSYVNDMELGMTIDGAISNGGGIRASISAGDISMDTLKTVFPFGNSVSIVTVTGAQLLEALEASCFACPEALGGFPQVTGIVFTLDTTVAWVAGEQYPNSTYFAPANAGSRVTIATVGGKDFALDAVYNIAVNNFTADGGDTYYVFSQASKRIDTEIIDSDGMIMYVNSLDGVIGEQYAKPAGNLTILTAENKPVVEPEVVEPEKKAVEYKVVKGDCLRKISEKFLGKESLWKLIYEANKDNIANPDLIFIGQVLQIPVVE